MHRTIVVRRSDILVINGYEVDASIVCAMLDPAKRLLWAFVAKDNVLQPVPYTEDRVIWTQDSDWERVDAS